MNRLKNAAQLACATALVLLAVLALAARLTVMRAYEMEGSSMADTVLSGEVVYANTFAYLFDAPRRGGDLVVFRREGEVQLKRVIGVPGDAVVIRNGSAYLRRGLRVRMPLTEGPGLCVIMGVCPPTPTTSPRSAP